MSKGLQVKRSTSQKVTSENVYKNLVLEIKANKKPNDTLVYYGFMGIWAGCQRNTDERQNSRIYDIGTGFLK